MPFHEDLPKWALAKLTDLLHQQAAGKKSRLPADINDFVIIGSEKCTVLSLALPSADPDLVFALLKAGAEPNLATPGVGIPALQNQSAMWVMEQWQRSGPGRSQEYLRPSIQIQYMLLAFGTNITTRHTNVGQQYPLGAEQTILDRGLAYQHFRQRDDSSVAYCRFLAPIAEAIYLHSFAVTDARKRMIEVTLTLCSGTSSPGAFSGTIAGGGIGGIIASYDSLTYQDLARFSAFPRSPEMWNEVLTLGKLAHEQRLHLMELAQKEEAKPKEPPRTLTGTLLSFLGKKKEPGKLEEDKEPPLKNPLTHETLKKK